MRLFIAIEFDRAAAAHLQDVQQQLRRSACRGSFPPKERLHLTLVFLGEVQCRQLGQVRRVMEKTQVEPMGLRFDRIERLGDLWLASPAESPGLMRLQGKLEEGLRDSGFDLERRAFRPHVTLGRRVELTPGCPEPSPVCLFHTNVDHIALFESVLTPHGPVYTRLMTRRPSGTKNFP